MQGMLWIVFLIVPMLIGLWAQRRVTSNYRTYANVSAGVGLTGADVARRILDRNGMSDVQIVDVPGEMTDHYDPRTRTVSLSAHVYHASSISAVSIAAHEVGHAIQHQKQYAP